MRHLFSFFRIIHRRRARRVRGGVLYQRHKESARTLVHARLAYWQVRYPFTYGQVRIKNQQRAWGSCSSLRNLNFNWRLVTLSPELIDYVVVHELCHTVHFNHSAEFWALLSSLLPNAAASRSALRAPLK